MAFSIFNKQLLLILIVSYIALFGFGLGKAQTGVAAGTGIGYIPQPGSGAGEGFGGLGGGVIAKVLVCLSDKIYSECELSYRLTERGDLHVPPDYTDQYCGGPCLKETDLVLNCINDVVSNFVFYNRATIINVKDTIKAGCGYGPSRGDFNVAEHLQANGSYSYKFSFPIIFWFLSFLISVRIILF
ncbi:hypothetical protein SSX86_001700 [Deinandra increscens subsp. villosa]|uniref:DUF7731 domain-containing protein n=1 Tax=Deinandra increscens subsp. villosa TaxID=3103831 RepID=A0AAP0HER6_9ASTR